MMLFGDQRVERARQLPVLRVAAGQRVLMALLDDEAVTVGVHWLDRPLMCPGSECPLCALGRSRFKVYRVVGVQSPEGKWRPCLGEFTEGSLDRLDTLARMESLAVCRGLIVEAKRRTSRSPLMVEPVEAYPPTALPAVVAGLCCEAVSVLYALPSPRADESIKAWANRARPAVMAHAVAAARR